jgi:hypothetical protein
MGHGSNFWVSADTPVRRRPVNSKKGLSTFEFFS